MSDPIWGGTRGGGVVRADDGAEAVTARLVAAGWQVAELTGVGDEAEFHVGIAAALGFPEHYGANLDALWDCLTDLAEPTAVVWVQWAALAIGHPRQWARLLEVLRERANGGPETGPAFAVVLTGS